MFEMLLHLTHFGSREHLALVERLQLFARLFDEHTQLVELTQHMLDLDPAEVQKISIALPGDRGAIRLGARSASYLHHR